MASNHTAAFGLNQWAATDQVVREEFNLDNQKIDEVLQKMQWVMGSYTGDGTDGRVIDLGFKPSILLLSGYRLYSSSPVGLLSVHFGETGFYIFSGSVYQSTSTLTVLDNGFQVDKYYHNLEDMEEHYLALR